jgi:predicted secreted protein
MSKRTTCTKTGTKERPMRRVLAALGCVIAVICTACASSAGSPSAGPQPTKSVHQSDNGRRISIGLGSHLVVTLDGTYWRFAPSKPRGVLRETNVTAHPSRDPSMVPGSGRGTVVAHFRAISSGTATVVATRTTCGEALHCAVGQRSYRLTVVVGR